MLVVDNHGFSRTLHELLGGLPVKGCHELRLRQLAEGGDRAQRFVALLADLHHQPPVFRALALQPGFLLKRKFLGCVFGNKRCRGTQHQDHHDRAVQDRHIE